MGNEVILVCKDIVKKFGPDKHFYGQCVRKITDIKSQDKFTAAQFPVFTGKDLSS